MKTDQMASGAHEHAKSLAAKHGYETIGIGSFTSSEGSQRAKVIAEMKSHAAANEGRYSKENRPFEILHHFSYPGGDKVVVRQNKNEGGSTIRLF